MENAAPTSPRKPRSVRVWLPVGLATAVLAAAVSILPAQVRPNLDKAQFFVVADRESYAAGGEVRFAAAVTVEEGWHVNSNTPTFDYLIPTALSFDRPEGWEEPQIEYPTGTMQSFAFAEEPISVYDGQFLIQARLRLPTGDIARGTHELRFALRYQACDDRRCLPPTSAEATVEIEIGAAGAPANQEYFSTPAALIEAGETRTEEEDGAATVGLVTFIVFGLIGGLLLNAMPCVLPVLSLKLLGLVRSRAAGRRHVVAGSLATAAGILVSFWFLAGAAIVARWAGATVGWGVQFQEPVFVTFLTIVVLLFTLNLWGLFEVPLPSRIAGWASESGTEGLPGHFTAGLFATLLATPCSAPFLGTAVGFALGQTTATVLIVFTAVGVGMALPYLLLAVAPRAAEALPRPGPWMAHFRTLMGFPLAAAAVWLLYVLASQVSPERLAFVQLALLGMALFVWMWQAGRGRPLVVRLAATGLVGSIATALALSAGTSATAAAGRHDGVVKLIDWVTFDSGQAESLAAEGRLVFVDVTADWCFTCKVNERLVLETRTIAEVFARHQVIAMKADWTNRNEEIAAFLQAHGKYGIPFYLLYRPGREPHLFSELLTKEAVVEAVEEAAQRSAESSESSNSGGQLFGEPPGSEGASQVARRGAAPE
jgi:suppressor for copper-sensitivity B